MAARAVQVRLQLLGDAHPQMSAARALSAQLLPEAACTPDPLQEFLDTCCELYPLAWCRISELWHAYEQWAVGVQKCVPLARRAGSALIVQIRRASGAASGWSLKRCDRYDRSDENA